MMLTDCHQSVQKVEQAVCRLENYSQLRIVWPSSDTSREQQLEQLEEGAEICVARPVRQPRVLHKGLQTELLRCTYPGVDGGDCMAAMGFEKQPRIIADNIRPDRRTLIWNAARSGDMEHFAEELLTDYIAVTIGPSNASQAQRFEQIVLV